MARPYHSHHPNRLCILIKPLALQKELAQHHVQGHLSVAPEHASTTSLQYMKKPAIHHFTDFIERFQAATKDANKEQFLSAASTF